jgi:hypothetical protein
MFNAKSNLQLNIIKNVLAALHTGLILVALIGCNAEQKLPSVPKEVQPPVSQPEVPNKQNDDDDDDDQEQENENQDNDKDDND